MIKIMSDGSLIFCHHGNPLKHYLTTLYIPFSFKLTDPKTPSVDQFRVDFFR